MNQTNPIWPAIKINLSSLCNGDYNQVFKAQVFTYIDNKQDKLYGEVLTNINQLQRNSRLQLLRGGFSVGELDFMQFTVCYIPNFTEYLRSGWSINMSLAIDFTASNGPITDPRSLHKQDPNEKDLNQYESALLSVGRIVEPYALN